MNQSCTLFSLFHNPLNPFIFFSLIIIIILASRGRGRKHSHFNYILANDSWSKTNKYFQGGMMSLINNVERLSTDMAVRGMHAIRIMDQATMTDTVQCNTKLYC